VTVVFLGEVGGERDPSIALRQTASRRAQDDTAELNSLLDVSSIVEKVAKEIRPFQLGFKGLGSFPDLLVPRIVWLGVNGDLKSLHRLRKLVVGELEEKGIWLMKSLFGHM